MGKYPNDTRKNVLPNPLKIVIEHKILFTEHVDMIEMQFD